MYTMLKIQEFILKHSNNWHELLTNKPYNLSIKQKDNRIMFNYRQGISDYSLKLVREARGLILNAIDFSIISIGFDKFFIFNSEFAADINWQNVRIEEKYDGSLITLYYYNNKWIASTSGCIEATDAYLENGNFKTFADLFEVASKNSNLDYDKLDKDNCYMFELISPYNKVVVDYTETELIHIGTRNRITCKESITDIGIKHPKTYQINNIIDCLIAVNAVNYTGEGFVVVDNNWNRIKVKSDEWFKWHYINNNNNMNIASALSLIRSKDLDEYLIKYTYHVDFIRNVKVHYYILRTYIQDVLNLADKSSEKTTNRKVQAMMWSEELKKLDNNKQKHFKWSNLKGAYFHRLNDKEYTVDTFIDNLYESKLLQLMEDIIEDGKQDDEQNRP